MIEAKVKCNMCKLFNMGYRLETEGMKDEKLTPSVEVLLKSNLADKLILHMITVHGRALPREDCVKAVEIVKNI